MKEGRRNKTIHVYKWYAWQQTASPLQSLELVCPARECKANQHKNAIPCLYPNNEHAQTLIHNIIPLFAALRKMLLDIRCKFYIKPVWRTSQNASRDD